MAFLEPLTQAFEKASIDVVVVGDADAAAAVFRDTSDDVPAGAVVDLLTVDDDAADLCGKVRERKEAESVPLLFIGTGQEGIRSTTDALIAGGDGFFQLPVEAPRVVAKVAAYLGVPLPVLPNGLLVTIDDHDLLERTPEPTRLVVPAARPEDLLGETDDLVDASLSRLERNDEKTPPGGTSVGDDFADTTTPIYRGDAVTAVSPFLARGPRSLEGDGVDDEANALLNEHAAHDADEEARLSAQARADEEAAERAADTRRRAEEAARISAEGAAEEELALIAKEAEREAEVREAGRAASAEADAENARRADEELALIAKEADEAARRIEEARVEEARADEMRAQRQQQEELEREIERSRAEAARLAAERAEEEVRAAALRAEAAALDEELKRETAARRALIAEEEARLRAVVEERQRAEQEALEADARKDEELRHEQERLEAIEAERRRLLDEADALLREQQAQRELEEARLSEMQRRRAEAEADAVRAADEIARLRQEAAAELEILTARREAEREELARLESSRREQTETDARSLSDLVEQRRALEEESARAAEERARRIADEEARLTALIEERQRNEAAAAEIERLADEDRARRRADEEARLQALIDERERAAAAAKEIERLADEDRARRAADEEARIKALVEERERRDAEQREAERLADEERARRAADEEARIQALIAERERLAAEQSDAERAAALAHEQRVKDEEARLAVLAAEAAALKETQERAALSLAEREQHERERLAALEIERARAEALAEEARVAAAARVKDEEARVAALVVERERQEAEAKEAEEKRLRLVREETERLEQLAREKRALEQRAAELSKKASDDEMLARARLAELEIARMRAEEESQRLRDEQMREAQQRIDEAAAAVAALEEKRQRTETEVAARSSVLREATAAEEERLQTLLRERERLEAELAAKDAATTARLADEERRLKELVERGEAERRAAAVDVVRLENDIAARSAAAETRLAELKDEQVRIAEAAAHEAERLALLRAEEEAARRELDDNRARARHAFVSGRFDAVPDRHAGASVVVGSDVGSDGRPVTDDDGLAFGGGLAPVGPDDREPPPPLPFVALEPVAGRFADGELPALLLSAHGLKVTGAVDIRSDDGRTRTLYLEEGEPVFVASAVAGDRAEEILLRGGLITAARHAELRAGPPTSARRLCARLVDDGALKLDELFSAVRGVLTEQVLALFEWGEGSFEFREDRAFAADRVRLGHPLTAVVAEGVRRKFDEARLWAVLGGPQTLLGPALASPSTSPLSLLRSSPNLPPLSPEETLALSRFDGTRALDDVILESGLSAHAVLRAALIGVTCGAVVVLARGLPRGPFEVIQRRERAVAIDRERVLDRLQLARHGDYFTFLGVDVDATSFEVHRAAQRLRERFDPARYKDSAFSDLTAAVQEIVDVAGDAEAVLADADLTAAYKKNLRAQATTKTTTSARKATA